MVEQLAEAISEVKALNRTLNRLGFQVVMQKHAAPIKTKRVRKPAAKAAVVTKKKVIRKAKTSTVTKKVTKKVSKKASKKKTSKASTELKF